MAVAMVPCLNTKLCGVQSHRPGTEAKCKATRAARTKDGRPMKGVEGPASLASRSSAPAKPYSFNADDMKEVNDMSLRVFQERQRIVNGEGLKAIRDKVNKVYGIKPHEEVEVDWENTYNKSGADIPVTVHNKLTGRSEHFGFPRQRVFPTGDKKGVVSNREVEDLVKSEQEVRAVKDQVIKYGDSAVREYVGESMDLDDRDEIRTEGYPAYSATSENIKAWRLRDGSPTGETFRIPREDIFPDS